MAWPPDRLGVALEALAFKNGLGPHVRKTPTPPGNVQELDYSLWSQWLKEASHWLGFEVEPIETAYQNLAKMLKKAAPAILFIQEGGKTWFLALQGCRGNSVSFLNPHLEIQRLPIKQVKALICRQMEEPHRREIGAILRHAGIDEAKLPQAEEAVLKERLRTHRLSCCWLVRSTPGGDFFRAMRQAGLFRTLRSVTAAHIIGQVLYVLSWWVIGKSAVDGRFDTGLLLAWMLLLLTIIPFQMLALWNQGRMSIGFGALLKQRLLMGALKLDADEVTRQGSGQLLGTVMESGALESQAMSTAFRTLFSVIDLIVAFWVMWQGAAPLAPWLLLLWMPVVCYTGWKIYRTRIAWTDSRLQMTNDLVERLSGYLTRLAQEPRDTLHDEEDWLMAQYLEDSKKLDRVNTAAYALIPNGWLALGLLGIMPAFIVGEATLFPLAVSLGGVILAYTALNQFRIGMHYLNLAAVAWKVVKPLFRAASRPEADNPPTMGLLPEVGEGTFGEEKVVLEAYDLLFRYHAGREPILRNLNLRIREGDRVLLEGPSGGGKSTLISLLLGMRAPESGLILLHGLDRHSLGAPCWRSRIASSPQFQENHVFNGTVAFNLLMGRRWPPQKEDLEEAEKICRELGLGELLDSMPSGLQQMLGENGWHLSHGERSRIYIARALLQGAELIIFDESFGTLDPENMRTALQCVFRRAPTLMVVAHP